MFLFFIFLNFILAYAFRIEILQNNNIEKTTKITNILNYIHQLDLEYSNKENTLHIELVESYDRWNYKVMKENLLSNAIAYYSPKEQKIYFGPDDLQYSTIAHEYFHHMTTNGFRNSSNLLGEIQTSIVYDYLNYNNNVNPSYWMSNYKEFSSTIFACWYNTLFSLDTNEKSESVYNEDKTKILENISPKLIYYLDLIYGKQDICNIITYEMPVPWCSNSTTNLDMILLKNPKLMLILLIPMLLFTLINIALLYFIIDNVLLYACYSIFVIIVTFIGCILLPLKMIYLSTILIYNITINIMNILMSICWIIYLLRKKKNSII